MMFIQLATDQFSCKAATHHPDSNQQPAAFIQPLRRGSSDPFSRKVALNTPLRRAANSKVVCTFCACPRLAGGASLVPVLQNMKTGNDGT